jgi:hypothetical protein
MADEAPAEAPPQVPAEQAAPAAQECVYVCLCVSVCLRDTQLTQKTKAWSSLRFESQLWASHGTYGRLTLRV